MSISRMMAFLFFIAFSYLYGETPYHWGEDSLLARRVQIKQQAMDRYNEMKDEISLNNGTGQQKSIGKAVVFSLFVPGSGQLYANSYLKAAVFLAVEVGAWVTNVSYKSKGDEKDREFKQYADNRWDEYRYWSYVNWEAVNDPNYDNFPGLVRGEDIITVSAPNGGNWYLIHPDYYQNHMDELLSILREIEKVKFSHRLPTTKTQQYYEMIGKYPGQFGNAWIDANFDRNYRGPDNITPNNDFYMTMRDDANRFYDIAQYGLMAALVNHLVSAIDAGFTARSYNRLLVRVEMSYQNIDYKGEYVNMLGVNLKW